MIHLGLALIPGAAPAAAKLALLLVLACAAGSLIKAVFDALLGGTDELP